MSPQFLRSICFQIYVVLFGLLLGGQCTPIKAMSLTGPIQASSVTVTGSVIASSITVSSLTITNVIQTTGAQIEIPQEIVQMQFSSTTITSTTTSSGYVGINDLQINFKMLNPQDYIRISLTGTLSFSLGYTDYALITIMRDGTDLGSPDGSGLAVAVMNARLNTSQEAWVPVGINLTDAPGDTSTHTYKVFIRVFNGGTIAAFPHSAGYFILEEVSR